MTILSHGAENVHSQVWQRFCWQHTQCAVPGLGHKTVSKILWTTCLTSLLVQENIPSCCFFQYLELHCYHHRFHQLVQFSCSVVSDSLWLHESQHARPPCPSPTPTVYSNSCPSSQWCHPAISSSVVPFSSCPQSLPASGSFPRSQLFAWGGQSIRVSASASVLPMNTQDWYGTIYYSVRGLRYTFGSVRNSNFVKQVKYK